MPPHGPAFTSKVNYKAWECFVDLATSSESPVRPAAKGHLRKHGMGTVATMVTNINFVVELSVNNNIDAHGKPIGFPDCFATDGRGLPLYGFQRSPESGKVPRFQYPDSYKGPVFGPEADPVDLGGAGGSSAAAAAPAPPVESESEPEFETEVDVLDTPPSSKRVRFEESE